MESKSVGIGRYRRFVWFSSDLGLKSYGNIPRDDPAVEKAYRVISLLRGYADRVTLFEENIIPYYLALLEWTYPVVSYRSANLWQKRFAAYSAGLIVRRIIDLE